MFGAIFKPTSGQNESNKSQPAKPVVSGQINSTVAPGTEDPTKSPPVAPVAPTPIYPGAGSTQTRIRGGGKLHREDWDDDGYGDCCCTVM